MLLILAVTGTTPYGFDRFVRIVDDAVGRTGEETYMQIGLTRTIPTNAHYFRFTSENDLERLRVAARLIIGHGGIGTLIDAAQHGKPLIVIPRRKEFGEASNNHQVETVLRIKATGVLYVAEDESTLTELLLRNDLKPCTLPGSDAIIAHLKGVIHRLGSRNNSVTSDRR